MPAKHCLLTAIAILTLTISQTAFAQSLQDDASDIAQSEDLGHAFALLGVLGSTPGISSGNFKSDMDLNLFKLPIGHSFGSPDDGVRPRVELALSRVDAKQVVVLDTTPAEAVSLRYDSYTALAGLGANIPLSRSVVLRPMALAGYSSISGDAQADGPIGEILVASTEGILADMNLENGLAGGSLELVYDKISSSSTRFKSSARYNLLFTIPSRQSDPSLRTTGSFSVATLNSEISGPIGRQVYGRDLRWIGFAKGTSIIGDDGDALGFSSYAEIGGGLELQSPIKNFTQIKGVALHGSLIKGKNVTGWTFGLGLDL